MPHNFEILHHKVPQMMIRFAITCFLTLFCVTGWGANGLGQPPTPRPQPSFPETFEGKIVAVTGKTIMIHNEKAGSVEFRLSDSLRKNVVPKGARGRAVSSERSYRPGDVKIGDIVEIVQDHDGTVFVCETIMIRRRPGGVVPEAPNETFDPKRPQLSHAFRMNAYQSLEEKGTPLPDCLIPPWERERIAPMPREVKSLGPVPKS